MLYVSLRNERIVADGLYVPSAGSVSVCVTGALGMSVTTQGGSGRQYSLRAHDDCLPVLDDR